MTPAADNSTASPAGRLRAADVAAAQQGPGSFASPVTPCGKSARQAVEAVVVDESGSGLFGVLLYLWKDDSQVSSAKTDVSGGMRFEGLEPGSYRLSLPDVDERAWELLDRTALDPEARQSSGKIAWIAPPSEAQDTVHEVAQGDCLSSIAYEHGFLPESLWDAPENAGLKEGGRDMNVLRPGDVVHLPARRKKTIPVQTGNRYRLRRKGVPAILRVRFVDFTGEPMANEPYLLQLAAAGSPLPDRTGLTDAQGFVVSPIPPNATGGEIWAGKGLSRRSLPFRLGFVDPIEDVSGVQARLNSLGYPCGSEDGTLDDLTAAALRRFQSDYQLPATGQIDEPTKAKLREAYGS
jgi:hypothetical protein